MLFGLLPNVAKLTRNGRGPLIKVNDSVIAFDARGCMADEHIFLWMGEVHSFGVQERGERLNMLACRVVKRGNLDYRDRDLGFERICLDDTCLNRIASGLWTFIK